MIGIDDKSPPSDGRLTKVLRLAKDLAPLASLVVAIIRWLTSS